MTKQPKKYVKKAKLPSAVKLAEIMENKVSIREAAEMLDVHQNTIRNYIEKGFLPYFTMPTGKKILIDKQDVVKLLTSHTNNPAVIDA